MNRAANSLLKIVIEDVVHENYDDLAVRVRAGLLLAKVIHFYFSIFLFGVIFSIFLRDHSKV